MVFAVLLIPETGGIIAVVTRGRGVSVATRSAEASHGAEFARGGHLRRVLVVSSQVLERVVKLAPIPGHRAARNVVGPDDEGRASGRPGIRQTRCTAA